MAPRPHHSPTSEYMISEFLRPNGWVRNFDVLCQLKGLIADPDTDKVKADDEKLSEFDRYVELFKGLKSFMIKNLDLLDKDFSAKLEFYDVHARPPRVETMDRAALSKVGDPFRQLQSLVNLPETSDYDEAWYRLRAGPILVSRVRQTVEEIRHSQ